nr:CMF_HP1_G0048230.mRNA.1.CDS.1 [Saccharomyces cerevisiae]
MQAAPSTSLYTPAWALPSCAPQTHCVSSSQNWLRTWVTLTTNPSVCENKTLGHQARHSTARQTSVCHGHPKILQFTAGRLK